MSFYNSKQEFSTGGDYRQSRGYSSRFSKAKSKTNNGKQILPFYQQKAASIIQKFWRFRMAMRRIYYESLYEEIYYYNRVLDATVEKKKIYLKGIEKQVETLQKRNNFKVNAETYQLKAYMKNLAKCCVGLAFKMQKRMLSQQQLESLLEQRTERQQRIEQLKKQKQQIRSQIFGTLAQNEQILLREIKLANSLLLQTVSQKHALKHKLRERAVSTSTIFEMQ